MSDKDVLKALVDKASDDEQTELTGGIPIPPRCVIIKKSGTDLEIKFTKECPPKLIELIRETIGKGGETIYKIPRPSLTE